jgi:hypothetical protein
MLDSFMHMKLYIPFSKKNTRTIFTLDVKSNKMSKFCSVPILHISVIFKCQTIALHVYVLCHTRITDKISSKS